MLCVHLPVPSHYCITELNLLTILLGKAARCGRRVLNIHREMSDGLLPSGGLSTSPGSVFFLLQGLGDV